MVKTCGLRHQQTIDIAPGKALVVSARLTSAAMAYLQIRNADDPLAKPLAARIVGPFFPLVFRLRRGALAGVARMQVFSDAPDGLDVRVRRTDIWWSVGHILALVWRKSMALVAGVSSHRSTAYAAWHRRFHACSRAQLRDLDAAFARLRSTVPVRIWIVGGDAHAVQVSQLSIARALPAEPAAGSIPVLAAAFAPGDTKGLDFFVAAGAKIEPFAIALLALRIAHQRGPCVAYADVEEPDASGRLGPSFTTGFDTIRSAVHPGAQVRGLLAVNCLDRLSQTVDVIQLESLAQAAAAQNIVVVHVPAVLSRLSGCVATEQPVQVSAASNKPEPVSLIIPSRDNAIMLEQAVRSLQAAAPAWPLQFVVVDHASVEAATQNTLQRLARDYGAIIVRAEGDFNFARLMNLGRAQATGAIIFSVNDDIEAGAADWLSPLVALLRLPGTGAVGPCLLYPDGTLQHAGVVLGINGFTGHLARTKALDDARLPAFVRQTRSVTTVTGAVLGVSARNWDRAGGWDEALAIEYNDTDFCVRLNRLGLRNIYCAHSTLTHHESVSRGDPEFGRHWPQVRRDREAFVRADWQALSNDAWYPANLSLRNTNMRLAEPPRRPPVANLAQYICDIAPPLAVQGSQDG